MFTGSQHSAEDLHTTNDIENTKPDSTDHRVPDQETDDEDGIDCKCVVCDRQCQDIDQ